MKPSSHKILLSTTATALGLLSTVGSANALSLTGATVSIAFECNNDVSTLIFGNNSQGQWQYVNDAGGDGVGGNHYDLLGMAMMEDANHVYFAINTYDMQLNTGAGGGTGWGDLLINTTGQNLGAANGNLFGIHFGANSGNTSQVGLYGDVTAMSVAGDHYSPHTYLSGYLQNYSPTLSDYLARQSSSTRNNYQLALVNVNRTFEEYVANTLNYTDRNRYNQAVRDASLSLETYVATKLNSTDRDRYNQAVLDINTSFTEYLSRQSGGTQQNYNNGVVSTVNTVNQNYTNFINSAQSRITTTQNNYNALVATAQTRITTTQNNYAQFIQTAQTRITNLENAYAQQLASRQGQNSILFGSMSAEQGRNYFDPRGANVMQSGTYLSGIEMLNMNQLVSAGYNRTQFSGGQTVAFRVSRSLLVTESVPEPTTLFGLAAVGLGLVGSKIEKKAKA